MYSPGVKVQASTHSTKRFKKNSIWRHHQNIPLKNGLQQHFSSFFRALLPLFCCGKWNPQNWTGSQPHRSSTHLLPKLLPISGCLNLKSVQIPSGLIRCLHAVFTQYVWLRNFQKPRFITIYTRNCCPTRQKQWAKFSFLNGIYASTSW